MTTYEVRPPWQKQIKREGGAGPLRAVWSGKRDLNPRPSPWQGDALPLSYSRSGPLRELREELGLYWGSAKVSRLTLA